MPRYVDDKLDTASFMSPSDLLTVTIRSQANVSIALYFTTIRSILI